MLPGIVAPRSRTQRPAQARNSENSGSEARMPGKAPVEQPVGPEAAVRTLQARAGNGAVQRMIQRRIRGKNGVVQRDDDQVMYMDQQGVGHKQPDQTKSHGTFFMDSSGVGHKEPDKSKSHGTIFMDEGGVGHKEPDKSPKRTSPF